MATFGISVEKVRFRFATLRMTPIGVRRDTRAFVVFASVLGTGRRGPGPYGRGHDRAVEGLAAARSRSRSDSPPDCHSLRSRRFATSAPTRQHSTISRFVSTFKRFCNKEYGENIWQRGFHDHVIRNREDYEEHLKYILENSTNWFYDELYCEG